ncbi:hypothetical protein Gotur_025886 [Gossypium turneri]
MEKGFLDKVEDNAAIQIWPETIRKRRVIVLKRGTCQSCGILLLTSTYFELSPNIETLLVVVLLLERWIWYLLGRVHGLAPSLEDSN